MPSNPNEWFVRVLRKAPDSLGLHLLEHNMKNKKPKHILRETYRNKTILFCNDLATLNAFKP